MAIEATEEFVSLRRRHGVSPFSAEEPWAHRHTRGMTAQAGDRFLCRCPGPNLGTSISCVAKATQEDILCDECRQWCIALSFINGKNGEYIHFADIDNWRRSNR